MLFKSLKQWIPVERISFPTSATDKKNFCIFFFGENTTFIESYNFLKILPSQVKHVYTPTISAPNKVWITPEQKKEITDRKLISISSMIGSYQKLEDKNFFFDSSLYIDMLTKRFKFSKFNSGKAFKLINNFIDTLHGIESNKYNKILLYTINLDKPFPKSILFKKFFPIFYNILSNAKDKNVKIPFDDILLFIYDSNGGRYIKIYDKRVPPNLNKIKTILTKLNSNVEVEDNKLNSELIANLISNEKEIIDINNPTISEKIKSSVSNLMSNSSTFSIEKNLSNVSNKNDIQKFAKYAIVFNVIGNKERTESIVKKIDSLPIEKQKEALNKYATKILVKNKSESVALNPIVKASNPSAITDYQWPQHIIQKRKDDFNQNLKTDIYNAFDVLSKKDIPLKIENIKIVKMESGPDELLKTLKDRYYITLKDKDGELHEVYLDIPTLTDNGTFMVNGQEKILINQLIRFPIFFPSINVGRFQSSFSVLKINSKELRNGAYFILFMGSYKMPLIQFLAYRYGLQNALKEFGVTYRIEQRSQ